MRFPGYLPQWLDGDAGTLHVHDQITDSLVLGRTGIGPGQQNSEMRRPRPGGPDLLAVDYECVALEFGTGAQSRQVGAGVGLGEELAPDLLAGEDLLQVACFLRFAAVDDYGGSRQG